MLEVDGTPRNHRAFRKQLIIQQFCDSPLWKEQQGAQVVGTPRQCRKDDRQCGSIPKIFIRRCTLPSQALDLQCSYFRRFYLDTVLLSCYWRTTWRLTCPHPSLSATYTVRAGKTCRRVQ